MSAGGLTPVLAVKSKEGELDALINTGGLDGPVQVMLELLGSVAPAGRIAKKIVKVGVEAALAGKPLWVDTTWLSGASALAASPQAAMKHFEHDIEDMLPDFDKPCVIPVVPLHACDQDLLAMRIFLEHQERPVVIRTRGRALTAVDLRQAIDRIAAALQLEVGDLHLVFDEGYVVAVEDLRVHALVQNIAGLAGRQECASITVLAGSTPARRTNYETHTRVRTEVQLWRAIQAGCGRSLRYGDYGVVHPVPVIPQGRPTNPNPYIHYTVPDATLSIARRIPGRGRGSAPRGASSQYFREVADELVRRPEFAGVDFSWGDRTLHSCRTRPAMPIGSSTKWVSLATSHHLAHLSKNLDTRIR
jgi:T4 beta protein